ncbi:MAG TPA: hypothetical protein VLT33_22100, partial [Labilithrix sp.]|nr:hypothetical protein [Labilithrix sp.]
LAHARRSSRRCRRNGRMWIAGQLPARRRPARGDGGRSSGRRSVDASAGSGGDASRHIADWHLSRRAPGLRNRA